MPDFSGMVLTLLQKCNVLQRSCRVYGFRRTSELHRICQNIGHPCTNCLEWHQRRTWRRFIHCWTMFASCTQPDCFRTLRFAKPVKTVPARYEIKLYSDVFDHIYGLVFLSKVYQSNRFSTWPFLHLQFMDSVFSYFVHFSDIMEPVSALLATWKQPSVTKSKRISRLVLNLF